MTYEAYDLEGMESGPYWVFDGKDWSVIYWDKVYPDVVVCFGTDEVCSVHQFENMIAIISPN